MSTSLAIDTSTSRTIVGIVKDGELLFSQFHEGATEHGPALPQLVGDAIVGHKIDRVVVGMGPGPYTGLRVGVAFARTFALARAIAIYGVCSLDAIVVNQEQYIVAIDARRTEIYWARYKDGIRIQGPEVSKPTEVPNFIIDQYPNMQRLVALSKDENISEPLYLRRPDAIATAERK